MEIQVDIVVVEEYVVTPEQKDDMLQLQIACFADQVMLRKLKRISTAPQLHEFWRTIRTS